MEKIKLFNIPISQIKGIGKKTEYCFQKIGINSVGSLLTFFPVSYENWMDVKKIDEHLGGNCVIEVEILEEYSSFESRNGKKFYKVKSIEVESNNIVELTFFIFSFTPASMKKGQNFLLMGDVKIGYSGNYEMVCPKVRNANQDVSKFEPIYQSKDLPDSKIRRLVSEAMKFLPEKLNDTIPEKFLEKYGLPSLDFTIRNIHFPSSKQDLEKSRKRIKFEELLSWILSVKKIKNTYDSKFVIQSFFDEFEKKLNFKLTKSQMTSLKTCEQDMSSGKTMIRLLQGDVGSGKTIVAMALAYNVIKSGFQVAIMVPTEVLAIQHYESFSKILGSKFVCMLTGSTNKRDSNFIREKLSMGMPLIVIGTHSLTSDSLEFKNLAFVVTDEQHRFGVNQRLKLTLKGENPHSLVMSATPIPRSLAMILYGDMDLCVINEMPKGRKKVKTIVIESSKRKSAFNLIKKQLLQGNQAYIVCPKVRDDDENSSEVDVERYKDKIMKNYFSDFRVDILHGQMRPYEKEQTIQNFASGNIDILVSTTVIEVGIDVPNATVILIENAEKFGLASLHQMRGRVGRGSQESYCILICDKKSESSAGRLETMEKSNDGFFLAQKDLDIRGPGDFFGIQQHGKLSEGLVESLKNPALISQSLKFADFISETGFKFRPIKSFKSNN